MFFLNNSGFGVFSSTLTNSCIHPMAVTYQRKWRVESVEYHTASETVCTPIRHSLSTHLSNSRNRKYSQNEDRQGKNMSAMRFQIKNVGPSMKIKLFAQIASLSDLVSCENVRGRGDVWNGDGTVTDGKSYTLTRSDGHPTEEGKQFLWFFPLNVYHRKTKIWFPDTKSSVDSMTTKYTPK